jgi:hypothetical protein
VAAPYYLAIRGRLVVVGKEPDGDSVEKAAGVWALDASAGFVLDDQASIGPEGS